MHRPAGARSGTARSLGAQLREFRTRAGFSQEALAQRTGLAASTLKALESDLRQRPHVQTLERLVEALGLEPAERAALLERASGPLTQPAEGLLPARAASRSASIVRLPVPPSALIGRDAELAEARRLLDPAAGSARLVTLIGPAGVGKTRLALAVAPMLLDTYPDGVVFVDLAPLTDPLLAPATVARALGVWESSGGSALDLVLAYLRARRMLLVLDNFEHLPGARHMVVELLQGCPHLALLVTSREALRLQGERRLPLGPLATPTLRDDETPLALGDSPAVQLFVERAQAVAADFALTPGNASTIASICRRLDGLPLAIELAAARVRLLPPASLLRRLEHRLTILTGGAADLPERQQALRTTLASSVDLLGPTQSALFRRLAVFAGGLSVEAAEAVAGDTEHEAGDVLDGVQVLVDTSLVNRVYDLTSEPRFRMLETVREYALEQLHLHDEAEELSERHAAYFLALAEEAEPFLRGAEQRAWFDRLDRELDNLRAVLTWAQSTDVEVGLRLVVALLVFWEERGHVREAHEWLETLLKGLDESGAAAKLARLRARALATAAWLAFMRGDYQRAAPLAEQSVALWEQLGQVGNSPVALNTLAYVARRDSDVERQEELFQQSLALCRAEGDTQGSAAVLSWLGTQRRASGDLDGATALLEESLRLYGTTGTLGGSAYSLLHLGGVARARHELERAQDLFNQSLAIYEGLGDRSDVAYAMGALAAVAADRGDLVHARSLCDESVAIFRQLGDVRGLSEELRLLGRIAARQGDDRGAAAAYAECLGLRQALRRVDSAFILEGLALALAHQAALQRQPTRLTTAVRLLGAAAALRDQIGPPASLNWSVSLPEATQYDYQQQVAATRAALGQAEFDAAWSAGQQLSLDQASAEGLAAFGSIG